MSGLGEWDLGLGDIPDLIEPPDDPENPPPPEDVPGRVDGAPVGAARDDVEKVARDIEEEKLAPDTPAVVVARAVLADAKASRGRAAAAHTSALDARADADGAVRVAKAKAADAARSAAAAARELATARRTEAADALADAEDALQVAQAKADEFEDDDAKAPWQRLAATKAVEKAARTVQRLRTAHEQLLTEPVDAADGAQAVAAAESVAKAKRAAQKAKRAAEKTGRDLASAEECVAAAEAELAAVLLDPGPPAEPEPKPVYASVDEWVEGWLAPIWRHRVDVDGRTATWCAKWWRHPEVVTRLDAIWRAWESLRQDAATGMSTWFRDHGDYHMAVITSVDGPLAGCTTGEGHRPKWARLPVAQPDPPNMFTATGK